MYLTHPSFWGIFWIDASTVQNAEQGFASIAQIGGAGHSCEDGKLWLTNLELSWMLVIDNADDPSIDVSRFFPTGDRGNILLTSRNTECKYHETVGYQELKEMEENEAITPLLRAAGKDHSNPKSRKLAGPIVQALGFLPLALDQAGASIRRNICSLKSYLTAYNRQRRQIMGTREIQGSEAYKYTVYTTWELSFQVIKLGDTAAADASEVLQMFAFLHFQRIPTTILQRAWRNSLRSQSWTHKRPLLTRILSLVQLKSNDMRTLHYLVSCIRMAHDGTRSVCGKHWPSWSNSP